MQAWHIGNFVGFAKLPPLEKVLRQLQPPKPRPPMTPEEIMGAMDLWRVAYGATHPKA